MFKNYFKTALRNFKVNKNFSIINVFGLSIGISAALVIFFIVHYEFSFDKFEKDKDRIYRVVIDAEINGTEGHSTGVQAPLSSAIQNEVTGVELTVPIMQFQGDATAKVSIVNKTNAPAVIFKKQPDIIFTNPQYFQLMSYKWIAGSPKTSLQNPFSVVLSESRAHQYFSSLPATDIIGRQITYNEDITATVSGIVKDLDENTAFKAAEFISYTTIAQTHLRDQFMMNVWDDWMAYSQLYLKLSKGINAAKTEVQLKNLLNKYNKDANNVSSSIAFHLQPLKDIHFNKNYPAVGGRIADKSTLYGLLAIAAFLLLLGCINFINLTTAHASHRAKEIGIRKTMGSSKKNLVFQFLSETFFITFLAAILSIVIASFLMKMFADFIPKGLHFNILHQPFVIVFLVILTIIVSFLSGLYPALILSGFKPVLVLKGQALSNSAQTRNAWVRKTFTVSQFVIAQFFVIATIMVSKQINFSINQDLGFATNGIITFDTPRDTVAAHQQQLLNEINAVPEVAIASTGFFSPADKGVAYTNISYAGKKDLKANVQIRWGDPNYLKVYQIKLLAGRDVQASDTMKEFIINDTYSKLLGFQNPEVALGKQLNFNGKMMPIVGVMQDFHEQSTRAKIDPLVFAGSNGSTFHIRLKPNSARGLEWKKGISKIEKAYKEIYPEADFSYQFIDEKIANLYESEQRTATLLKWSTGFAILISCLGLLGLVIFTSNSRTKEIGVRKVLGASVMQIISTLSADFIRLVLLAFIIAAPIAWWASYKWLQNFAYRTNISWWVFVLSGLAMLLLALITLSMQTIKAARANPVKSLRSDS